MTHSLFDQEPPPEGYDPLEYRRLKTNRRVVVVLCAAVSFVYGLATGNSFHFDFNIFFAIGLTIGFLLVPTLLAAFVSRASEKWHYTFAASFVIIFGLIVLGKILRS